MLRHVCSGEPSPPRGRYFSFLWTALLRLEPKRGKKAYLQKCEQVERFFGTDNRSSDVALEQLKLFLKYFEEVDVISSVIFHSF